MQVPVEITIKNIEKNPQLEEFINKKISKMEKLCDYMISCRVSVERPQKSPSTSNPHRVRIDIKVPPSHEIVAKSSLSRLDKHIPIRAIINKTFQAAEHQLKKVTERQHGIIKNHPHQQIMVIVPKFGE